MVHTFSIDTFFFILILINFLLSFSYRSRVLDGKDIAWLRAGLFFTLCADFCMLIVYRNTAGLLFFIPVQWIYHARYAGLRRATLLTALLLACAAALFFVPGMPAETKLACLYALCLCFSVSAAAQAFFHKRYPKPNRELALAGMLLFLLCDVHVMLYNVLPSEALRVVCRALIWLFYLPSQLCLCLSGRRFTRYTAKGHNVQ